MYLSALKVLLLLFPNYVLYVLYLRTNSQDNSKLSVASRFSSEIRFVLILFRFQIVSFRKKIEKRRHDKS
jgi:hypothetical protein